MTDKEIQEAKKFAEETLEGKKLNRITGEVGNTNARNVLNLVNEIEKLEISNWNLRRIGS